MVMNRMSVEIWTIKAILMRLSDGNEEHLIGNWRKGHRCYKMAKDLAVVIKWQKILSIPEGSIKEDVNSNELGRIFGRKKKY